MTLSRRLTRLEARKPPPGPVRVLRLILAPGATCPALEGAAWRGRDGWHELARDPCEAPDAFTARAWAAVDGGAVDGGA